MLSQPTSLTIDLRDGSPRQTIPVPAGELWKTTLADWYNRHFHHTGGRRRHVAMNNGFGDHGQVRQVQMGYSLGASSHQISLDDLIIVTINA